MNDDSTANGLKRSFSEYDDDFRLLTPGEKEVRNLRPLQTALRRITLCEQAGTGLRRMREEWKKPGRPHFDGTGSIYFNMSGMGKSKMEIMDLAVILTSFCSNSSTKAGS